MDAHSFKLHIMLKRRRFIQQSGAAALGGLLFSNSSLAGLFSQPVQQKIGLQLFTFFNSIDNDVSGTLKKIAGIGYTEIESAFSRKGGYYGMKPAEFNDMLKGTGLVWKAHHVIGAPFKLPPGRKMPLDADGKPMVMPVMRNLRDNYQELVDEVAAAGVPYLVCASTPISSMQEIKESIDVLKKTGDACKKAGVQFVYHNHDAEFRAVEGNIPYDLFLAETDPAAVKMELDLAWAVKGGMNPVELFKKHPGRFPLWHVKDLDAKHETVLPVGAGTIDFKPIFAAAKTAGMKHFFVEHDMPQDAVASITSSYGYLTNTLKV